VGTSALAQTVNQAKAVTAMIYLSNFSFLWVFLLASGRPPRASLTASLFVAASDLQVQRWPHGWISRAASAA
jgi:hypothetical protein